MIRIRSISLVSCSEKKTNSSYRKTHERNRGTCAPGEHGSLFIWLSWKMKEKIKNYLLRLAIYIVGVIVLGAGIVLCVRSDMGVSPINSIPYVLTHMTSLSLGTISFIFYIVNIIGQLFLCDKKHYIGVLLQLPVSVLFGIAIDFWDVILPTFESMAMHVACLCGSLVLTAFGIMLVVAMRLVPDPPTGTIHAVSEVTKKNMGSVKCMYDLICVIISLSISFLGLHELIGFGVATIMSVIFVGRILAFFQKTVGKRLNRYFPAAAV